MKAKTVQINWHDKLPLFSVSFNPETEPRLSVAAAGCEPSSQSALASHKLATAGGDHNIRLWSICVDPASTTSSVEFVATLNRHSSVVNCVRWSPKGSILASGGDDGTLILWHQQDRKLANDPTNLDANSDDSDDNKEYWKIMHILRGCSSDIYDLAWSPDGTHVIAGCLDNSARIWNVKENRCIHVLAEHANFVQGVAWDPLNEFIASQSSDRALLLFSIESSPADSLYQLHLACIAKQSRIAAVKHIVDEFYNLMQDKDASKVTTAREGDIQIDQPLLTNTPAVVTPAAKKVKLDSEHVSPNTSPANDVQEPPLIETTAFVNMFHDDTLSSFFRRLTFSPDGSLLVAPAGLYRGNVKENAKNVVYIFSRENLRGEPIARLSGFKKPAIAVRFSPVLYHHRTNNPASDSAPREGFNLPYHMYFAVASQEAVAIYDTASLVRPVAVIANLHFGTLTDVTWSNDGRVLVLASTDGYCSIINFSDVELGVAYVPPVPKGLEEQDLVAMEVEKNVEPITVKEPLMVAPAATVNVLHAGLIKKKILPVASQAMDCGDTDNMENKTTLSNSLK